MNCKEFDTTGYPPDSSGLDKLQVGFVKCGKVIHKLLELAITASLLKAKKMNLNT